MQSTDWEPRGGNCGGYWPDSTLPPHPRTQINLTLTSSPAPPNRIRPSHRELRHFGYPRQPPSPSRSLCPLPPEWYFLTENFEETSAVYRKVIVSFLPTQWTEKFLFLRLSSITIVRCILAQWSNTFQYRKTDLWKNTHW